MSLVLTGSRQLQIGCAHLVEVIVLRIQKVLNYCNHLSPETLSTEDFFQLGESDIGARQSQIWWMEKQFRTIFGCSSCFIFGCAR